MSDDGLNLSLDDNDLHMEKPDATNNKLSFPSEQCIHLYAEYYSKLMFVNAFMHSAYGFCDLLSRKHKDMDLFLFDEKYNPQANLQNMSSDELFCYLSSLNNFFYDISKKLDSNKTVLEHKKEKITSLKEEIMNLKKKLHDSRAKNRVKNRVKNKVIRELRKQIATSPENIKKLSAPDKQSDLNNIELKNEPLSDNDNSIPTDDNLDKSIADGINKND